MVERKVACGSGSCIVKKTRSETAIATIVQMAAREETKEAAMTDAMMAMIIIWAWGMK